MNGFAFQLTITGSRATLGVIRAYNATVPIYTNFNDHFTTFLRGVIDSAAVHYGTATQSATDRSACACTRTTSCAAAVAITFAKWIVAGTAVNAAIAGFSAAASTLSVGAGFAKSTSCVLFYFIATSLFGTLSGFCCGLLAIDFLLSGAFLTLAIVIGEFTIASLLNQQVFGVYMQNIGANRAYEPAALSIISFLLTWGAMGMIAFLGRFAPKTAPRT